MSVVCLEIFYVYMFSKEFSSNPVFFHDIQRSPAILQRKKIISAIQTTPKILCRFKAILLFRLKKIAYKKCVHIIQFYEIIERTALGQVVE